MSEQSAVLTEQIERMRREILGNKKNPELDDTFKDRLKDAKNVFLNKVYPFDKDKNEIPARYTDWQTRCAIELHYLVEDGNYTSYAENGLSWSKDGAGISKDLLNELPPPQAGVPS